MVVSHYVGAGNRTKKSIKTLELSLYSLERGLNVCWNVYERDWGVEEERETLIVWSHGPFLDGMKLTSWLYN